MGDASRSHRLRGLIAASSAVVITAVTAAFFAVPVGAAVRRGASPDAPATTDSTVATLVVDHDQVDVRKADRTAFRAARDGQQLHEGDTVRTDETGRATINYTDKSFTRLDVSTEFTIVELTDDQGTRDTSGALETGRVWNRVEDLAESEGFSTAGAGATAAVTGTAYTLECPVVDECTFTGIYHEMDLSWSILQAPEKIGELQHVTVKLGVPGDLGSLSVDDFLADVWIQTNLAIDAFLGFAGPDLPKHVTIVTFGGRAIVVQPEVGGIVVERPPEGGPPPPPPPPPPPNTSPNGYGAGGGTNQGGASFGGGVGNCMAVSAHQKAQGSQPDPEPCLNP